MAVCAKRGGAAFLGVFVALAFVAACGTRGSQEPTETGGAESATDLAGTGTEIVTEGLAGGALEDPFAATEGATPQPDLGTGAVAPPAVAPGTTVPGPEGTGLVGPTLGTNSMDHGTPPVGGASTGAGGMAGGMDTPVLVLGALTAAAGTIALARRRQVRGNSN